MHTAHFVDHRSYKYYGVCTFTIMHSVYSHQYGRATSFCDICKSCGLPKRWEIHTAHDCESSLDKLDSWLWVDKLVHFWKPSLQNNWLHPHELFVIPY